MEVPEGHDGSAAPIAQALMSAGIAEQDKPTSHIKVSKPVHWSHKGVELSAVPHSGFRITFMIDYDHPLIGVQELSLEITPESFLKEIAPARTFGFLKDAAELQKRGLALGGSLDNAIVLDEERVISGKLRFRDEFVRHKVLTSSATWRLDTLARPFRPGRPSLITRSSSSPQPS
jgi:UDP-3-O-[3-hydroxymyristoyl] N-acetylglucosamine deacetylase